MHFLARRKPFAALLLAANRRVEDRCLPSKRPLFTQTAMIFCIICKTLEIMQKVVGVKGFYI